MKISEQVINEILLKSTYGAHAYEERQKRLSKNDLIEIVEDEINDHPHQIYIDFEEYDNE